MHHPYITTTFVWLVLSATCRMAALRDGLMAPSPP
jgi:hypothetical protein